MSERKGRKPEVVVAAIVVERRLVLLSRRTRRPAALLWHLPGGSVDFGESLHDALTRELREELGIVTEVEGSMPVAISSTMYPEVDRHAVTLYFRARVISGVPTPKDGTDAVDWFTETEARLLARRHLLLEPSATALGSALGWKI